MHVDILLVHDEWNVLIIDNRIAQYILFVTIINMGIKECDARLAKSIVDELVSKGIKVLALDFDKTIVDVHTAGEF